MLKCLRSMYFYMYLCVWVLCGSADISEAMEHLTIANAKIYSNFTTSRALTASVAVAAVAMVMVTTSLFFFGGTQFLCLFPIVSAGVFDAAHLYTPRKHLDLFGSLLFCHYDFMNIFTAFHLLRAYFPYANRIRLDFCGCLFPYFVELKVMGNCRNKNTL